jgi:hypothetical protein
VEVTADVALERPFVTVLVEFIMQRSRLLVFRSIGGSPANVDPATVRVATRSALAERVGLHTESGQWIENESPNCIPAVASGAPARQAR